MSNIQVKPAAPLNFTLFNLTMDEAILAMVILVVSAFYAFINPLYSPIDEYHHFDYINHIIANNKIPLFFDRVDNEPLSLITEKPAESLYPQYQAVHPPLYYIALSIPSRFFVNFKPRILFIRFVGGIFLAFSAVLALKLLKILEHDSNNRFSKKTLLLNLSIILVFFLNPGIIVRSTTVSNETLVILLVTFILVSLFLYLKNAYPKLGYNDKVHYTCELFFALLCAMSVLTKLTSVFIVPICAIAIFFHNVVGLFDGIKRTSIFIFTTIFLISPWFIYNLIVYGQFTATSYHLDFVLPITNPTSYDYQFLDALESGYILIRTYWFPQEWLSGNFSFISFVLFDWLTAVFFIFVVAFVISFLTGIIHRESLRDLPVSNYLFHFLLLLFMLFNLFSLIFGTVETEVDVMIGRYIYMNSLSLAIFYRWGLKNVIQKKYQAMFIVVNVLIIIYFNFDYLRGLL